MGSLIFPEGKPLPLSDFRATLCAYEPTRSLTTHFFFLCLHRNPSLPGQCPAPIRGQSTS